MSTVGYGQSDEADSNRWIGFSTNLTALSVTDNWDLLRSVLSDCIVESLST